MMAHSQSCKEKPSNCTLCSIYEFLKDISESDSDEILKPECIVDDIKRIWKSYEPGLQEDCHEFIIILLQSMLKASLG